MSCFVLLEMSPFPHLLLQALHLVHRAAEECADSAPLPSAASQDSMVRQAAMQHAFRSLASKRMFHVGSSAALSEAQAEPRCELMGMCTAT